MKNTFSAIITSGGNGTRFNGDKMLALLKGKPLILHTLEKFHQSNYIDEIILLVKKEGSKKRVNYFDLYGLREEKYKWLEEHDLSSTDWQELNPADPNYFFIPENNLQRPCRHVPALYPFPDIYLQGYL